MSQEILHQPQGVSFENNTISQTSESISQEVFSILSYVHGFPFIEMSDNGIFINIDHIKNIQEFKIFVDKIFENDFYFEGLDYRVFTNMLLDYTSFKEKKIKLCTHIKKIDPVYGKNGMSITAEIIKPEEPQDIDMFQYAGEGVGVIQENGDTYFVAMYSGYVIPLQGDYNSSGQTKEKLMEVSIRDIQYPLRVTKSIELGIIGPKTGNIEAVGDVQVEGIMSGYQIQGDNIVSRGDVNGNIIAKHDISITGNVSGGVHQQMKTTGVIDIKDGQVKSIHGNIEVVGNVLSRAYLQAMNGNIKAMRTEASILIGKSIQVENAYNTILIGDDIQVTGEAVDCMIISSNSTKIKELQVLKNDETRIFVMLPEDYEKSYTQVGNMISDLTIKNKQLHELISRITQENSEILGDKKIMIYSQILKKYQGNKNSLTQQENQIMTQMSTWYQGKISQYTNNNKNLLEAKERAEKIQKDLETLSAHFQRLGKLRQAQVNPQIEIEFNQGEVKIFSLKGDIYKNISEFTQQDIENIINISGLFSQKYFQYKLLESISDIQISWNFLKKI